ncbi:MAG: nucleotidyltransferase family protein, partial [Hormoscilla sp. SP5CHS1]|nr:nucleotidyltransferase family protein [Hormoscilla sp. SP5CHS1]
MKTLAEIKESLSLYKSIALRKYQVTDLGIFGSYVRGEQNADSDVDVLIDYIEAPDLIELLELEDELSERLGVSVDVVTKNGLKPRLRERILSEVVYSLFRKQVEHFCAKLELYSMQTKFSYGTLLSG